MSAESIWRERERERSRLSADFKFPSGDLAENLNNFKQVSRGNHGFTEQSGSSSASLQTTKGLCATPAMSFHGPVEYFWSFETLIRLDKSTHLVCS